MVQLPKMPHQCAKRRQTYTKKRRKTTHAKRHRLRRRSHLGGNRTPPLQQLFAFRRSHSILNNWMEKQKMSQELIQEIDLLRKEIQQLKSNMVNLYRERTELQEKIEAAKTIWQKWKSDEYSGLTAFNEIKKVLEEETTK